MLLRDPVFALVTSTLLIGIALIVFRKDLREDIVSARSAIKAAPKKFRQRRQDKRAKISGQPQPKAGTDAPTLGAIIIDLPTVDSEIHRLIDPWLIELANENAPFEVKKLAFFLYELLEHLV